MTTALGIDEDEWKLIKSRALLTCDEVKKIKEYEGFKPFLPVTWALGECRKQVMIYLARARTEYEASTDPTQQKACLPRRLSQRH